MCGRAYIFVNYFSYFKIIINIHYHPLKQKKILFEPITKMNISTQITTPTKLSHQKIITLFLSVKRGKELNVQVREVMSDFLNFFHCCFSLVKIS